MNKLTDNFLFYFSNPVSVCLRNDLIAYGGVGVTNNDPEQMVEDMLDVQAVYGQKKGRRMHHYTYTVNREEYGKLGCCDEAVERLAKEMSKEAFLIMVFKPSMQ